MKGPLGPSLFALLVTGCGTREPVSTEPFRISGPRVVKVLAKQPGRYSLRARYLGLDLVEGSSSSDGDTSVPRVEAPLVKVEVTP